MTLIENFVTSTHLQHRDTFFSNQIGGLGSLPYVAYTTALRQSASN